MYVQQLQLNRVLHLALGLTTPASPARLPPRETLNRVSVIGTLPWWMLL